MLAFQIRSDGRVGRRPKISNSNKGKHTTCDSSTSILIQRQIYYWISDDVLQAEEQ
jgi:hypothetical protein